MNETSSKSTQAGVAGFQSRKTTCLSKRDRSSAGRIDPKAVDICAAINARDEYYTTSSCAGRSFLYCGDGIKAHHHFASNKIMDPNIVIILLRAKYWIPLFSLFCPDRNIRDDNILIVSNTMSLWRCCNFAQV